MAECGQVWQVRLWRSGFRDGVWSAQASLELDLPSWLRFSGACTILDPGDQVLILAPSLTSCVILNRSLHLSGLSFPIAKSGEEATCSVRFFLTLEFAAISSEGRSDDDVTAHTHMNIETGNLHLHGIPMQ